MAVQPRASELTAEFLQVAQTKGGLRINTRNLSVWSVLGAGMAQMAVRTNLLAVEKFDDATLERASGTGLDEYCSARGPVRRFDPRKSRGPMTFARPTTGAGGGDVTAGTEIRVPFNGKSYVFTVREDTAIKSSELTVTVDVEAQQPGAASNVGTVSAALALTGLPAPLFDTTLAPTSVTVAGGADGEEDAELRTRQRLYERGKRGGVAAAVAYGALSVNGVKHVVLAHMRDPHRGVLSAVYVGDVNWQSTQDMRDEVAVSLEDWRAWGPSTDVRGIAQSDVPVSATMQMLQPIAFYDINGLRTAGVQAVVDYFERRKDPYAYDLSMLKGRLARVNDEVSSVVLAAPLVGVPSPLTPSALKIAGRLPSTLTRYRTSRSLVTVDVEGPI
jgi:hypothetical protein